MVLSAVELSVLKDLKNSLRTTSASEENQTAQLNYCKGSLVPSPRSSYLGSGIG